MKQVLQNLRTGSLAVTDVPPPVAQRGRVIVRTAASLISAGTERMAVSMGRKSLLGKARERPDLVRQVIQKARNEGVLNTIGAVRQRLDASTPLGYSAAGIVTAIGEDITEFRAGDRVSCAGAGYASHAEVLSVPKNLCARLPSGVSFEAGAFGTVGAIALQGIRLAEPTLGESVVVIGLGLLGQLTVQLLKANGCRVFGIDLDPSRVAMAREFGADGPSGDGREVKDEVLEWSRGYGADAVLITAATSSSGPLELAGEISRQKGRVVAVGLVGMNVPRRPYYDRELTLRISMSYGPGRYDPNYEERGHDYPFGYVRWTENRNIAAFLDLCAEGRVNTERLVTHRFPISEAEKAYTLISGDSREPYLGVLLSYDTERPLEQVIRLKESRPSAKPSARVMLGMIGAGNYAKTMLLPNFRSAGVEFCAIATGSGITARDIGDKYGFAYCASSSDEIMSDSGINLVVIATRHNTHADLARRALAAGKDVFVEKPLALTNEELEGVLETASGVEGRLTVGFNRRFSPLSRKAAAFFAGRRTPLSISYRVNAGHIPLTHWTQDPVEGGGRIIGEVCHFVDLMQYLTGSRVERVFAEAVRSDNRNVVEEDSVFITLRFTDGSNGSIAYLAEGDKAMPKERIEIFGEGKVFVIDDFRSATSFVNGRQETDRLRNQDKGQADEVRAVCDAVRAGAPSPIALDDLATTTRATFRIRESLRTGQAIEA